MRRRRLLHCETVLRGFYEFHLRGRDRADGQPVPAGPAGPRAHAHHNPMEPFRQGAGRACSGRGWPRGSRGRSLTSGSMSCSPGWARTGTGRWSRSGSPPGRAPRSCSGLPARDADPGQQLITVIRKGSRAMQQLPASPDAFVWLRLYQEQMRGLVPAGPDDPVWWTLRRPFRQLAYHAARAMFVRANAALGANWSLHDLRHYRGLPAGPGPADADHGRAVDPGPRASVAPRSCMSPRRRKMSIARRAGPSPPPGRRRSRRRSRRRATGPSRLDMLFGKGSPVTAVALAAPPGGQRAPGRLTRRGAGAAGEVPAPRWSRPVGGYRAGSGRSAGAACSRPPFPAGNAAQRSGTPVAA